MAQPQQVAQGPVKFRSLRTADLPGTPPDAAGTRVFKGSWHGMLLHTWGGFAWVLWAGKHVPETWPCSHLWVAEEAGA
jgi:hypothetical protein